jgi:ABC-2 type transport system ATP-binding protein
MTTDRSLEIKGISKRYGETVAVQDLSLEVRAGELFGFVGRNGAGKTTTMRIVLGVLTPDKGEVRWDGVPLDFAARRRIGYMPEERGLYPKMRLIEQLAYLGELHGMTGSEARDGRQHCWSDLARRSRLRQCSLASRDARPLLGRPSRVRPVLIPYQ